MEECEHRRSFLRKFGSALAETIIGLCKTDVIHARGPWRTLDVVE
jgi:hypothetical protein